VHSRAVIVGEFYPEYVLDDALIDALDEEEALAGPPMGVGIIMGLDANIWEALRGLACQIRKLYQPCSRHR